MSDILDRIVAVKVEEVAAARAVRDLASLQRDAEALGGQRDFVGAIKARGRFRPVRRHCRNQKGKPQQGLAPATLRTVRHCHQL